MNSVYSTDRILPTGRKILAHLCAVLLCGFCSAGALAQNVSLPPTYGSVTLTSGFSPDPHVVDITAGGSITASTTESSCSGYVSDSPDFQLTYEQGQYALSIFAIADSDITLMINAPDGTWHCNDDSSHLDGTNPGVHFATPMAGRYDIWVGAYSTDNNYISTKLLISETAEEDWRTLVTNLDSTASEIAPLEPIPVIVTPEPEPEPEPTTGIIQYGRKEI